MQPNTSQQPPPTQASTHNQTRNQSTHRPTVPTPPDTGLGRLHRTRHTQKHAGAGYSYCTNIHSRRRPFVHTTSRRWQGRRRWRTAQGKKPERNTEIEPHKNEIPGMAPEECCHGQEKTKRARARLSTRENERRGGGGGGTPGIGRDRSPVLNAYVHA